jgi:hypothetical protein
MPKTNTNDSRIASEYMERIATLQNEKAHIAKLILDYHSRVEKENGVKSLFLTLLKALDRRVRGQS